MAGGTFTPNLTGAIEAVSEQAAKFVREVGGHNTAMAIQNGAHRLYLPGAPPTTLMTGTTTQIMIDLVDIARADQTNASTEAHTRLRRMIEAVAAFALGCAAAATLYWLDEVRSFLVPPLLGVCVLYYSRNVEPEG